MVRTDVATTASSAHGDHHGQDNFVALLCSLIVPACLSSAIPHGSIGSVRLSPENITGVAIALAGQTGTALNPGVPAEGRLGLLNGERGAPLANDVAFTTAIWLPAERAAQSCERWHVGQSASLQEFAEFRLAIELLVRVG